MEMKDEEDIILNVNSSNNDVAISPMHIALEKARKLINKYHKQNKSLVDELIKQRRIEAQNE